jgi:hypothetical protein
MSHKFHTNCFQENSFPFKSMSVTDLFNSWTVETHRYSKMFYGLRPQIAGTAAYVSLGVYNEPFMAVQNQSTATGHLEFLKTNNKYFKALLSELPFGTCIYGRFNDATVERDQTYASNKVSSSVFYVEGCYYPEDPKDGGQPEKLFTQHADVSYVLGLPSNGEAVSSGKLLYEQGIAPLGHYPDVITLNFEEDSAEEFLFETCKRLNPNIDDFIYNFFKVAGKPLGFVLFPMFSKAPQMHLLKQWTASHQYE